MFNRSIGFYFLGKKYLQNSNITIKVLKKKSGVDKVFVMNLLTYLVKSTKCTEI